MSEYWVKYLKANCQTDMDRIVSAYPKEKVLHIDVSKILDTTAWGETLSNPGGQEDHIKDALTVLLPKRDDAYAKVIVRYNHVTQKRKIKQLRPSDEKKLIAIKSLVKRVSEVRPKIVRASFECPASHIMVVNSRNGIILPPRACTVQGCEFRTLEHLDLRDVKIARQWMFIQDPLEDLTDGGQPSFLKCELLEDLCGKVMAGDRVIANGQYRSIPVMKGAVLTDAKDVYFDVSSLEVNEREFEEVKLTDEDEKLIIELSKSEHLFEKLTESVAPSILGMKLLKQAIVLQLFEGVTRKLKDGVVNRGHINVLCVSDPGMAKTKLLRFVASIAPRGVFTNATTSTKVGLVAPIVRDETTGEYTVQAGAYMIASGGILCLDEVSELDKGEFKYLNEAMEDGEAHITKGGLNITVKTRASLLAACNPIEGSFDSYQPLAEQVKIPESTLSRFDLKILLQDISEEGKDRKMIEHITSTHMDTQESIEFVTPDMLRKYIAFGRKLKPRLTSRSKKIVDDYYVGIRKETGSDRMKVTPRQGTAVIRLAEAHARMRLSDEVSEGDAIAARNLFDMCFRNVATDPVTGTLDVSRTEHRGKGVADALLRIIRGGTDGKASETEILTEMNKLKFDSERVLQTLRMLKNEGKIIEPKNGLYKVM